MAAHVSPSESCVETINIQRIEQWLSRPYSLMEVTYGDLVVPRQPSQGAHNHL